MSKLEMLARKKAALPSTITGDVPERSAARSTENVQQHSDFGQSGQRLDELREWQGEGARR
jgi:hypothetical protein